MTSVLPRTSVAANGTAAGPGDPSMMQGSAAKIRTLPAQPVLPQPSTQPISQPARPSSARPSSSAPRPSAAAAPPRPSSARPPSFSVAASTAAFTSAYALSSASTSIGTAALGPYAPARSSVASSVYATPRSTVGAAHRHHGQPHTKPPPGGVPATIPDIESGESAAHPQPSAASAPASSAAAQASKLSSSQGRPASAGGARSKTGMSNPARKGMPAAGTTTSAFKTMTTTVAFGSTVSQSAASGGGSGSAGAERGGRTRPVRPGSAPPASTRSKTPAPAPVSASASAPAPALIADAGAKPSETTDREVLSKEASGAAVVASEHAALIVTDQAAHEPPPNPPVTPTPTHRAPISAPARSHACKPPLPPSPSHAQQHQQQHPPRPIGLLSSSLPPPTPATAHKRYTSVYPCASKLLAKKWDDAARTRHLEKLKTMKARIDNVQPRRLNHLAIASKKLLIQQESCKRIERENHLLLERMRRLFDSPSLYAEISPQNSRTMLYMRHKALVNRRKRREEHDRIHTENLMLMQRVENKRAHYRARDCDRDRERHLRYLLNMTRFPEAYRRAMVREGLKPGTTPLAPGASRRDSSGRGDSGDGDVQATQQDSIGNASEGAGDHRGSRAGSGSGSGSTISTATKKRLEATSRNMARIGAAYGIKPGELASRGSGSASGSARGSARSSTGSKSSSGHPRDSSSSTKSSTKSSARNHAEPEIKGSSVAAEPVSSAVEPQPAVPEPHGVQILQAHDRTALGFFDDPEQVSLPLSDGSQNDGQATSPPPIDAPLPVILTQSSAYEYTFDDFEDDSEAGSHDIQHGTVVATAAAADGGETVSYRIPVVSIPVDITARADAPRDPDTDSHSHSQSRSSSPHSASKEASDNASGGDEILESASAGRSSAMLDDPFFD